MRTSPTGRCDPPRNGFTLVELMVAIVIVGLMATAVVLSLPDPQGAVAEEAERFAARAKAARERAIMDNRSFALALTAEGYRFEARRGREWEPLERRPFAPVRWRRGTDGSADSARLVFDPTGFAEPFRLTLTRGGRSAAVEIRDGGEIRVRR